MIEETEWDLEIKPQNAWFDLHFKELWKYRDLILLFVRRDFVSQFKQTILGPLWHIIQPLLTTFLFTIVFSRLAKIQTGSIPPPLFYLSGIIVWNFFSGCLLNTANTFVANAGMFGKIYFPRLVIPISTVLSTAIRFGIQFMLYLVILLYYLIFKSPAIHITFYVVIIPFLLVIMGTMGMGMGIVISSLTTKYRDFSLFLGFGVQLLMYLTPIIYPSSFWGNYKIILRLNPITPIIESFRYAMMGVGNLDIVSLIGSAGFSILVFFLGALLFNRTERNFMDTV
jgi:lipopolysaccharide transport system permease protein